MQLRWVLAATILVGLAGPGGQARAGGLQEAGSDCMQYGKPYGYSMQVPDAWQAFAGLCLRLADESDRANSSGNVITSKVTIERHSYWDDARARASIRNDLNGWTGTGTDRTQYIAPKLLAMTIAGRKYLSGIAASTNTYQGGSFNFVVEQAETFYQGYMYKFHMAIVGGSNTAQDAANAQEVARIWNTIRIPARPLQ